MGATQFSVVSGVHGRTPPWVAAAFEELLLGRCPEPVADRTGQPHGERAPEEYPHRPGDDRGAADTRGERAERGEDD
jgi:hypothetical protein